jgi:NADH dehydrogenase [ubiquinone] 1 alpha subcomplex assembly factor 7
VSLREQIIAEVRQGGDITIARYLDMCLHDPRDGYYARRPRLGAEGDFVTAPHVSQMFGEVLGLWVGQAWAALGRPARFSLIEMGPGDGLMMRDVLSALRTVPDCLSAHQLWLVETSSPLRTLQQAELGESAQWIETLAEAPRDAPVILLANEVLDCLPVRQAVRACGGWRERLVGVDDNGDLRFTLGAAVPPPAPTDPSAQVFEWSDAARLLGQEVGRLVTGAGGAALFIDYGDSTAATGDTLQALRSHRRVDPLAEPGDCDLTAHADFAAFIGGAREAGARCLGPLDQGDFLRALGIELRADALARGHPDQADKVLRQLRRLVAPSQMGSLFKAVCACSPGLAAPVFDPGP